MYCGTPDRRLLYGRRKFGLSVPGEAIPPGPAEFIVYSCPMAMPRELTSLQRSTLERLKVVGMEDFAARASAAWMDHRPYPCALTPAERATMEGANLCEPFKAANQEARAAQAAAAQSCQV